jgi:hypothetical protein
MFWGVWEGGDFEGGGFVRVRGGVLDAEDEGC